MTPSPPAWARRHGSGWLLAIRVQPGARRSEVVGEHGDQLKVRVAAPATDGKANAELVRFLAEALEVPRACVQITRGASSRSKQIAVDPPAADDPDAPVWSRLLP